MTKFISETIDDQSFSRLRFKLLLRNETSHTQITKFDLLKVIEFQDDGIIVEMPLNACQKSHNVTLFFIDINTTAPSKLPENGPLKGVLFEAITKVASVEMGAKETKSITAELRFSQYDVQHWKQMMQTCTDHQSQINKLMIKQNPSEE